MNEYAQKVLEQLKAKAPWETEFLQAVTEVFETIGSVLDSDPRMERNRILERMTIPERIVTFQVPWVNAKGEIQVNTGYRVQFNSAIGPYKGGLRFHPSVTLSILKFLGFEQTFKNALTTLPMGGGKGGSDFNPKGKTDLEVMAFCNSFMRELYRHIGPDTDVPAGDLGVGTREIGYLYGQYKRITGNFHGVLTGKGLEWGGSLIRPEATGFGAIYFVQHMLDAMKKDIKGKRISVSGYGNVAWGVALKATQLGAKVVTISSPVGYVLNEDGLTFDQIDYLLEMRARSTGAGALAEKFKDCKFFPDRKPWEVEVDIAMPCATQNELTGKDAKLLAAGGAKIVAEVSNMGCTPEAAACFRENGIAYAPGKAVNAGGVATSGLEMAQNASHSCWKAQEVDKRLQEIMKSIHDACVKYGKADGKIDYVAGANIAGFRKVSEAMLAEGI